MHNMPAITSTLMEVRPWFEYYQYVVGIVLQYYIVTDQPILSS